MGTRPRSPLAIAVGGLLWPSRMDDGSRGECQDTPAPGMALNSSVTAQETVTTIMVDAVQPECFQAGKPRRD